MTVSEAISYCRNRMNALTDNFWSDLEIMALIQARCNEVLSIIGEIEDSSSATLSVASTQAYAFPTDFEFIKRVSYNGTDIQQIDFKDWDLLRINGVDPTGTPRYFVIWNRQINLIPIPDTSALVIKIYAEKKQETIDATTDTINLPEILHARILDGVIADMYSKDENTAMTQLYEQKWLNVHIPAFRVYKQQYRRRGRFAIVKDADSSVNTDFGVR
jgi:hypothetical protein